MKNLLDPLNNARTIGFLLMIVGIINLLGIQSNLLGGLFGIAYAVIGWGLMKQKLWGLYGLVASVVFSFGLLAYVYFIEYTEISSVSLITNLIGLFLAIWLMTARKRFSK
jgi:hypothetical protein